MGFEHTQSRNLLPPALSHVTQHCSRSQRGSHLGGRVVLPGDLADEHEGHEERQVDQRVFEEGPRR